MPRGPIIQGPIYSEAEPNTYEDNTVGTDQLPHETRGTPRLYAYWFYTCVIEYITHVGQPLKGIDQHKIPELSGLTRFLLRVGAEKLSEFEASIVSLYYQSAVEILLLFRASHLRRP